MKRRVAVLGLGEFGKALATELTRLGVEVLAVDVSARKVEAVRDLVASACMADIRDGDALHELFATSFDVAVVAIGGGLEAAILATLHLKQLNVDEIWVEANTRDRAEVLKRVGATRILSPEGDMGRRLAQQMANPNLIEFLPLTSGFGVVEAPAPKWTVGKTLKDLELRNRFSLAVISIRSLDGKVSIVPGGLAQIGEGDVLTLVGSDSDLASFRDSQG